MVIFYFFCIITMEKPSKFLPGDIWLCSGGSRRRLKRPAARDPGERRARQRKSRARCGAAPPPPPPGCAHSPAARRVSGVASPSRPGPAYTTPSHLEKKENNFVQQIVTKQRIPPPCFNYQHLVETINHLENTSLWPLL